MGFWFLFNSDVATQLRESFGVVPDTSANFVRFEADESRTAKARQGEHVVEFADRFVES